VKATYRKPTGFSDPRCYETDVEIVGFCSGKHIDHPGETVLAIFHEHGDLDFAPVRWFTLRPEAA
jgi:hypothetical protein